MWIRQPFYCSKAQSRRSCALSMVNRCHPRQQSAMNWVLWHIPHITIINSFLAIDNIFLHPMFSLLYGREKEYRISAIFYISILITFASVLIQSSTVNSKTALCSEWNVDPGWATGLKLWCWWTPSNTSMYWSSFRIRSRCSQQFFLALCSKCCLFIKGVVYF